MVFSCVLKNMKGVVQDKVHYQMHQTNLAEAMVDLWSIIRADVRGGHWRPEVQLQNPIAAKTLSGLSAR